MTPFTFEDAEKAYREWGANCGPGALAAIMGMTLEQVRPHIPDFDAKRYTSPTMMYAALKNIGRPWEKIVAGWPIYGLVRVQWEGPWTKLGVPIAARYRYTHWVGAQTPYGNSKNIGIFDINCMNNGTGWVSLNDWSSQIAPYLIAQYPKADGKWHLTHAVEVSKQWGI